MCVQIDLLYACKHRSFIRFEYCPELGRTCYGAGGKHHEEAVQVICGTCKQRRGDPDAQEEEAVDTHADTRNEAVAGRQVGGGGTGLTVERQ